MVLLRWLLEGGRWGWQGVGVCLMLLWHAGVLHVSCIHAHAGMTM